MLCGDVDALLGYVQRQLHGDPRRDVEAHLDGCARCRELVAEMARTSLAASVSGQDAAGVEEATLPIVRGQKVGRYLVLEWLGRGGMGTVYEAYDPDLDRKVALKLLHVNAPGAEDLAEARAMAKVSHTHVVSVFDVGTYGNAVFLTMESIRGGTLRDVFRGTPSASAVVRLLLAAGRGLAAVHAAGLVHGDFKPENVLVDDAGHAKVTDFGLARLANTRAAADRGAGGTPGFMAPEQAAGEPPTARSDQYAFCLTLREGLERSNERGVPRRLRRALARGLAADPTARFTSMAELLAAIAETRWRGRTAAVAIAATLVVVTAVGWGTMRRGAGPPPACPDPGSRLAGVWDEPRRHEVGAALVASGLPYARDTSARVTAELDRYARSWAEAADDTCQAAHVRHEQSAEAFDLRMACLDDRRVALKALVTTLSRSDPTLVEGAMPATLGLPPVATCRDVRDLRARGRPAPRAEVASRVSEIRGQLAEVKVLGDAARYGEALRKAVTLAERGKELDEPRLQGELLVAVGRLRLRAGEIGASVTALWEAAAAAERGTDDGTKAEAWTLLVLALGYFQTKGPEALALSAVAEAALERAHASDVERAALDDATGLSYFAAGNYATALARLTTALTLREAAFGPRSFQVAASHNNVAMALVSRGSLVEAAIHQQVAFEILRDTLGGSHPTAMVPLVNLANTLRRSGRVEEALGRATDARSVLASTLERDHPNLALAELNIGLALERLGRLEEAESRAAAAVRIYEKKMPGHPLLGNSLDLLGRTKRARGRLPEALADHQRALQLREARPADHDGLRASLVELGSDELELGRAAEARQRLERALALLPKEAGDSDRADTELALSRALHGQNAPPGGASRALGLADQAVHHYRLAPGYEREAARAEAWRSALTREARGAGKGSTTARTD